MVFLQLEMCLVMIVFEYMRINNAARRLDYSPRPQLFGIFFTIMLSLPAATLNRALLSY